MRAIVTALGMIGWCAASAAAPAPPAGCAALTDVAGRACVDTPNGVVLAAGPSRAAQLAGWARAGEARFLAGFGAAPPRYAVVELTGPAVDQALDARLKAQGYVWRLPWLSAAATAEAYRASITRAARAKAEALKLPPPQVDQVVAAALAQQARLLDPAAMLAKEEGALPHELGHGWLTKAFWPAAATRKGDHYGGPAPDWLDETAAVTMENDAFAEQRRRRAAAVLRGADADARARLLDLETFLSGGHPALPVLDLPRGGGVQVLTGEEAAKVAEVAGTFYLQARLFADYLVARSGDPAVLRGAARRFAEGRTTAEWLRADAARLHTPAAVAALSADWRRWADAWSRARSDPS